MGKHCIYLKPQVEEQFQKRLEESVTLGYPKVTASKVIAKHLEASFKLPVCEVMI